MPIDQAKILLTLIQGQDGEIWASGRVGWKKGDLGVCFWDGVLCDSNDQATVMGLLLTSKGLSGTLPTQLGLLTTLRELDMPQNQIRGRIPSEVANLPHLETINLAENELTGTIPKFASAALQSVDLSHNLFAGRIDPDLGLHHPALTDFDVTHNKLTGPLPTTLDVPPRLDTLSLSENRLSGTIPATLGGALQLKYLYLDNNYLMGTIPPELAHRDSPMEELWLQENLLTGTIPARLADLKELFNFYVDGNKFTGTVPQQLCRETMNEDFYEELDDDFPRDYCDSIACEPGFVAFEGVYPCEECNQSYYNPYLGRVGNCIDMDESDILEELYEDARGSDWLGGVNWNRPNVEKCSMTGVRCDDYGNIVELVLKDKGLRGNIPESLGFLRFLEKLDLSDNQLTGFVPVDLMYAPLSELDLTGNELRGILPHKLCSKAGINGNGDDNKFSCDAIMCSVGYTSPTGRGTCHPCKSGTSFLGSKTCFKDDSSDSDFTYSDNYSSKKLSGGATFGVAVVCVLTSLVALFSFFRVHRHLRSKRDGMTPVDTVENRNYAPVGTMS